MLIGASGCVSLSEIIPILFVRLEELSRQKAQFGGVTAFWGTSCLADGGNKGFGVMPCAECWAIAY